MAIIEVNHVTKEFKLGTLHGVRQSFHNSIARLRGQPTQKRPLFKALDDIDFKVEESEVLGIIGHNGAGKSTLLKLLANITPPTHGSVNVKGKVAPLIEVGAGLVGDLTGRENIFLNGAILGIPKCEIKRKFDEIVAFAELEEFVDTPIKRYSSGMAVRLGFAIATSVNSDILIVDEVLAVGDLAFQRKCFDRMEELIKRQGKTVLLVSHNIRQVQRLCSRVILLDQGKISNVGLPRAVCNSFYQKSDEKIKLNVSLANASTKTSGELELIELNLIDHCGQISDRIEYNQDCVIQFKIRALQELEEVTFGFGFHTTDFLYLTTHNSEQQITVKHLKKGDQEVNCTIEHLPLLPGIYSIRFGVTAGQAACNVFYGENLKHFQVVGEIPVTIREGFFALNADWALKTFEHPVNKLISKI